MLRSLDDPKVCVGLGRRFEKLAPSTLPRWGAMSSPQMLRHLALAFEMALGDCAVLDRPERGLDRPIVRFVVLSLPVRWPHGTPTIPEIDIAAHPSVEEPATPFTELRSAVISVMTRFSQARDFRPAHPLLGRFTRDQWMRWGFLHTDHHLRQFGC